MPSIFFFFSSGLDSYTNMQRRAVCSFALSMKPWARLFFFSGIWTNIPPAKVCSVRTTTWVLCHFLTFRHWSDSHVHKTIRWSHYYSLRKEVFGFFFFFKLKLKVGWSKLWHLELQSCSWIPKPCRAQEHCWNLWGLKNGTSKICILYNWCY